MKPNGTLLNTQLNGIDKHNVKIDSSLEKNIDENFSNLVDAMGDDHVATSYDTPMRVDAFLMSDETKIKAIEQHF